MSVAVLDRKINDEEKEKLHNSQISEQYKKLIDPESTLLELLAKSAPINYEEEYRIATKREAVVEPVREQEKVYRVENARADAEIFRADGYANSKEKAAEAEQNYLAEEEDNEDLRPTQTTIAYRTGAKPTAEKGKIEIKQKKTVLTSKDKIIIAVAAAVILALFILIIVNSAIISGLNNEVASLQTSLTEAKATFVEVVAEKDAYLEEANLFKVVSDYAANNGMILIK